MSCLSCQLTNIKKYCKSPFTKMNRFSVVIFLTHYLHIIMLTILFTIMVNKIANNMEGSFDKAIF